MSDKTTTITLPGQHKWGGIQDWGHKTASEMLAAMKRDCTHLKEQIEILETAKESDFRITQQVGVYVSRNQRVLQEGSVE